MKYFIVFGLVLVIFIGDGLTVDLPPSLKPCKRSIPNYIECATRVTEDVIVSLGPGLKSLNILPLEPLAIESLTIGATGGPISLKQLYKNIKIHGLTKESKIHDLKINVEEGKISGKLRVKNMEFLADVKGEGKLLGSVLEGSAKLNITFLGHETDALLKFNKIERYGESYFNLTDCIFKNSADKVIFKFDNITGVAKALLESLNSLFNDNSEIIYNEFKPAFEKAFALIHGNLIRSIFNAYPISTLFPE